MEPSLSERDHITFIPERVMKGGVASFEDIQEARTPRSRRSAARISDVVESRSPTEATTPWRRPITPHESRGRPSDSVRSRHGHSGTGVKPADLEQCRRGRCGLDGPKFAKEIRKMN